MHNNKLTVNHKAKEMQLIIPDQDSLVRTESQVAITAQKVLSRYSCKNHIIEGIINVTYHPYNADKTGKTDATAAIQ